MYPAQFEYFRPTTVDEAVKSLNAPDSRAKAGDQSLAQAANEFSEFFRGQWLRTAEELGSGELAGPAETHRRIDHRLRIHAHRVVVRRRHGHPRRSRDEGRALPR